VAVSTKIIISETTFDKSLVVVWRGWVSTRSQLSEFTTELLSKALNPRLLQWDYPSNKFMWLICSITLQKKKTVSCRPIKIPINYWTSTCWFACGWESCAGRHQSCLFRPAQHSQILHQDWQQKTMLQIGCLCKSVPTRP